jgi:hypothetical protein
MKKSLCTLVLLTFAAPAPAADAEWQPMLTELLKSEKTEFGGLCGIAVDHRTGCVWVNLSGRGMYCSSAGAKEFKRVSDAQPKGRTESPGCFMLDPDPKSKRMVTALVYGSPIAVSPDHGATWKFMDKKSGHVDWCAVDWSDPETKFVMALKHEAGGLLMVSNDGGTTFRDVGKGYATGWIFDGQTAVVAEAKTKERPQPNLMRTTDGGKTFKECGQYSPVGASSAQALPKWHDGTLYWLVEGGLIATTDKGATWKKIGEIKDAQYGPVLGKDAKQMFVLTKAGVVESTDGGTTWLQPIAAPKDLKGIGGLSWLEYDPSTDSLYIMKMGSNLFKLTRGK